MRGRRALAAGAARQSAHGRAGAHGGGFDRQGDAFEGVRGHESVRTAPARAVVRRSEACCGARGEGAVGLGLGLKGLGAAPSSFFGALATVSHRVSGPVTLGKGASQARRGRDGPAPAQSCQNTWPQGLGPEGRDRRIGKPRLSERACTQRKTSRQRGTVRKGATDGS